MTDINSFEELRGLPDKSVVQDANGAVWCVQRVAGEIWLCPFSDEYSYSYKSDGTSYALGDTPALPIKDLGIVTTVGG